MRYNTKGLILREQNIGERDKLVTVLTEDMGIVKAFVRGAKSIKSKKHSTTGQFCYSQLSFYSGKDSYIIDEAQSIEMFFELRSDIEKLALAQYFAELACELSPQDEQATDYLRLMLNALYMLAHDKKPAQQLKAIVELRLMSLSGYTPSLVACERCGEFETPTMYFDVEHGLLYCENCASGNALFPLSLRIVTAMRHIVFSSLEKLFSFKMTDSELFELSYITEIYTRVKSDRNFKTLEFYNSMRTL